MLFRLPMAAVTEEMTASGITSSPYRFRPVSTARVSAWITRSERNSHSLGDMPIPPPAQRPIPPQSNNWWRIGRRAQRLEQPTLLRRISRMSSDSTSLATLAAPPPYLRASEEQRLLTLRPCQDLTAQHFPGTTATSMLLLTLPATPVFLSIASPKRRTSGT